jgi:hypothetical protein
MGREEPDETTSAGVPDEVFRVGTWAQSLDSNTVSVLSMT